MKKEEFCALLGSINERYVEDARADRKVKRHGRMRWSAAAACLCLAVAGSFLIYLYKPADFNSMVRKAAADTAAVMATVPVDGRTACYQQVNLSGSRLKRYVGEEYLKTDAAVWYLPDGTDNLKYLIRKDGDNLLTLWVFTSFAVEAGESYTYGDVLSVIYGADSAADIVSITTSPFRANNTPEGKAIQREVGTHTYTDREEIAAFYAIVKEVVCYGAHGENPADSTRFSYSFSTESGDKLTSGASTYGTRCLSLALKDGTVLDSWKYSALSGSFFEYGGIFTQPLEAWKVDVLNNMFGIS